jgi:hypothetical protein
MCLLMENPIEEAFAKIKNLLRNAAARSKETLVEAGRSDRGGAIRGDRRGRPGLLRARWIPPFGSLTVKRAVEHRGLGFELYAKEVSHDATGYRVRVAGLHSLAETHAERIRRRVEASKPGPLKIHFSPSLRFLSQRLRVARETPKVSTTSLLGVPRSVAASTFSFKSFE